MHGLLQVHPGNLEWTKSRMRCLHELGEWPRLSSLASSVWEKETTLGVDNGGLEGAKQEMAPLASAAEFILRDWDRTSTRKHPAKYRTAHPLKGIYIVSAS